MSLEKERMTSEIVVDGEVISLPTEIMKNPWILKHILTTSTWRDELTEGQRISLSRMLPSSSHDEGEQEKEETIKMLLSGEDLLAFPQLSSYGECGNPVGEFASMLERGYYAPEAYRLRRSYHKMCKAKQNLLMHKRYHQLLKEVIVSRQCHLEVAANPKLRLVSKPKMFMPNAVNFEKDAEIEESANLTFSRILNEITTEARLHPKFSEVLDSDSELEINPINSTRNAFSLNYTITPRRYRQMLLQHKRRRDAKVTTPDLNVSGIRLADVMSRTFVGSRKMAGMLSKKRKPGDSLKRKQKKVKTAASSNGTKPLSDSGKTVEAALENKKNPNKHSHSHKFATRPSCFFELIKDVLLLSQDKTKSSVQQLVSGWLASAESSRFVWTSSRNNWEELVDSALQYLKLPHQDQGSWLVEESHGTDKTTLRWINQAENKTEMEMKDLLKKRCADWTSQLPAAPPGVVVTSPIDDVTSFQTQERRRYLYPHQAFVYTIGGVRYPVPPVKGSTGPTKEGRVAREHCLLRSERPPQVTLLALTRDAVARLPGGTGTRNDVCNLIRESQYLAEVVTDSQINAAVSGALDRLHYEVDPCVKFDSSARSWLYLHSDRSIQDLERLHAEQLGAPKKKRQKEKTKKTKAKSADGDTQPPTKVAKKKPPKSTEDSSPSTKENPASATVLPPPIATILEQPVITNFKTEPTQSDVSTPGEFPKSRPSNNRANGAAESNPVVSDPQAQQTRTTSNAGTTTIQLTQRQLLEMTRKLATPAAYQGAREVLITQRGSGATARPTDPKANRQGVALQRSIKGTLVSQQNGQPSLKLILKPATGDQQKPTAELVRVVEGNKPNQAPQSSTKQHVLTAEAIRRLSEQLSAATSRPIKIVQQAMRRDGKPGENQNVINITRPSAAPPSGNAAVATTPIGGVVAQEQRRVLNASRNPTSVAQLHSGGDVNASQVYVISKQNAASGTRTSSNNPVSIPTGHTLQANRNVKTKTLQIMSGGKIQTVQVLSSPTGNSPSLEIIPTHSPQAPAPNHPSSPQAMPAKR